ncbi:ankyrin repeat domain-containing protein [Algoriphagus sp. A40]|uniref:ankyrin repeat domain-containing protein n=1 Tax=Algoriphagus sp. A40 TaxID=1945863 RepID=UPI001C2CA0E0|nr:ankyrin repeat domain-containing protein [Algoriphagus sp. A40]
MDLNIAVELHDVAGIKAILASGPAEKHSAGKPLIWVLIGEYTRGPRFKDCVRVFLENGHGLGDPILEAVLLDNVDLLRRSILENPGGIHNKHSLPCAYTPFLEVSLLHICAEFNHFSCAEVLIKAGLDINAKAGVDEFGFGGQTPIFLTVNQNTNQSKEMLDFCLEHGADLDYTVRGLIWGKGYPWETLLPSVNPISYAMMGLLPQMHRKEATISDVVSKLLKHRFGIEYQSPNIPNKYLKG